MSDRTVANTILNQLGGRMFCMMVGMKSGEAVCSDNHLAVRIRGAKAGSNGKPTYMKVELTAADLYDVTFFRIQRGTMDLIETGKHEGLYADMLRSTFTDETGLHTSL